MNAFKRITTAKRASGLGPGDRAVVKNIASTAAGYRVAATEVVVLEVDGGDAIVRWHSGKRGRVPLKLLHARGEA